MKPAVALALLLALAPSVGAASGAPADVLPDAATLLARSAAAGGPTPAIYRETVVAGDETRTTYHRNGDERTVIERGPIHTEEGLFHGARWHRDANGVTVLDDRATGAAPAVASSSVRRVATPVAGYLVETFDAKGYGTRRFLDGTTLLVRRIEDIEPSGTTITTYEEFGTFGGRTLPTRWTIADARSERSTTETLSAYAEDGVAASDVAVPPIRPDLVTFPSGARDVTLPARFIRERVYVQVGIGGRALDFVLDTGESGMALDADLARELSLAVAPDAALAPAVTIGALKMHDVVFSTIPQFSARTRGAPAGILGFDFLASLGVTIDYEHAKVTVVPALRWSPPKGKSVVRVPVRLLNGVPLVRVALNGETGERFVLDTGAVTSVLVTRGFARDHGQIFVGRGTPEPYAGLGGTFDVNRFRVRNVAIEQIAFRDINVLRPEAVDPYPGIDGLIGTSLLHYFTVDLHYADSSVYLTRNAIEPRAEARECNTTTIAWRFHLYDCMGGDTSDRPID
jgi:predicted aspartyl protease